MPESPSPKSGLRLVDLPPGKRILFGVFLVLLPLAALALLEGIGRLAGLGGYPPVIRSIGPTGFGTLAITDPAGGTSYFFANRKRPGFNEQYSFFTPKPAGTIRIVLVGESALKGYPQPRNLAVSAFLRQMLKDAWPERKVETINLGTTAVASYPVLDILTQALEYQPDLVIVHTGHNEFFGTYGVASIGWAGSRPWSLRATRLIHSLALVQAMEKVLPSRGAERDKTLMQVMMARTYVGPNDWRRPAAANNLGHNVAEMVKRCRARKVPVIVCNQPSNEHDLAPFGKDSIDHLQADIRTEFEKVFALGLASYPSDLTNVILNLDRALALCPTHARAHYFLGKALMESGERERGLRHLERARDLDPMPWRAPSSSQQAIVQAAREQGAILCDLEAAFRSASPGGAIGWELMDDHVHPTLLGQAVWARALCETLKRVEGSLHLSPQAFERLVANEEYARRLGDNPFDRYGVAHQMRVIFDMPFMRETNPEAFARFHALATQYETNYPADVQAVMREWQSATPHAGGKRPLTGMVARVLMRQGRYAEALDLFRIAATAVPDYTSWHMEYVYFGLACQEKLQGTLSEADKAVALEEIKQGRFLLQHGFSEFGLAERYLGRLHQLRGEFAEAIPFLIACRKKLNGNDLVAADQALVVSYLKTGQNEKARQVIDYGIANSGAYASQYERMLAGFNAFTATNQPSAAK